MSKDAKIKETTDEKEYYRTINLKMKTQLEEAYNKIKSSQEEIIRINESKKLVEEKSHSIRFNSEMIKKSIKEKDNEIFFLKEEIKRLEFIKTEQTKLEKKSKFSSEGK